MGLVQFITQEEFSDRFAKIIANELNIDVAWRAFGGLIHWGH